MKTELLTGTAYRRLLIKGNNKPYNKAIFVLAASGESKPSVMQAIKH